MNGEKIIYREAEYSDKDDILRLFKECFSKSEVSEKDPDLWEWQMILNPEGKAYIGLAEIENKLIGHYVVIPFEYLNKNRDRIKIGLVVDVMVHPQYQRKGIFVALSKYSLPKAVKKLNLSFTIGYPFTGTTLSSVIPGHRKVGWELGDKLSFFMLPIKVHKVISYKFPSLRFISKLISWPTSAFLNIRKMFKSRKLKKIRNSFDENSYQISLLEDINFTKSDINLFQKYSEGKFIKDRSMQFIKWRFQNKSNAKYKIIRISNSVDETMALGVVRIAYLKNLRLGIVMDLFGEIYLQYLLLRKGIDYLKRKECDAIALVDYKKSEISMIRDSLGFINTTEHYQLIYWKEISETISFPKYPRLNFVDFDIF